MVLLSLILPVVNSQEVPPDIDSSSAQKVQQEHQATRKFFSDELTRQKKDLFLQFDDRGKYYENQFTKIINGIMIKLALIWIGIVVFTSAFNKFLGNRMDKRRYKKLKDAVLNEVKGGITHEVPIPTPSPNLPIHPKQAQVPQPPQPKPKITPEQWIQAKQQQIMKDQQDLIAVMNKMDSTKGVTNR